jgi:hypothetical protein
MRNPKSPFALTKTEEWVLAAHDQGLTTREIAVSLGRHPHPNEPVAIAELASALEKRRVMLLDDRKPMGNTRLNIARGAKRMAR